MDKYLCLVGPTINILLSLSIETSLFNSISLLHVHIMRLLFVTNRQLRLDGYWFTLWITYFLHTPDHWHTR